MMQNEMTEKMQKENLGWIVVISHTLVPRAMEAILQETVKYYLKRKKKKAHVSW